MRYKKIPRVHSGEMEIKMVQDIHPSKFYNEYNPCEISDKDYLIFFNSEGKILLGNDDDRVDFPTGVFRNLTEDIRYLFSIDDRKYFLAVGDIEPDIEGYTYYGIRQVRNLFDGKEVFAVFTAYHLCKWYNDNMFCGKCAGKLVVDEKERALRCPECGNVIYPRINPAVIVGVIKNDSILITRYRTGYAHNALVAGFTEIGETLEETVAREVMEETGVKVKNICYYKSQPWGMAQDILVGFFCEADGEGVIRMDENELKFAGWVKRDELELQPNSLSLTNEMMKRFKDGEV